jgi:hypothetical protein
MFLTRLFRRNKPPLLLDYTASWLFDPISGLTGVAAPMAGLLAPGMILALGLGMGLRRKREIPMLMEESFADFDGEERKRVIEGVRAGARDIHDRLEQVEPGKHILVGLGKQMFHWQNSPAKSDPQYIRGLANVLMYGWVLGDSYPTTGQLLLDTDADAEIARWRGKSIELTSPPYAYGSLALLLLDRGFRYGPLHDFGTGGRRHFQMATASSELATEIRAMAHLGDQSISVHADQISSTDDTSFTLKDLTGGRDDLSNSMMLNELELGQSRLLQNLDDDRLTERLATIYPSLGELIVDWWTRPIS